MLKKGETIYYSKEMTDDFGTIGHNDKPLKKNYKYISKNIFYRCFSFLFYYIAKPILFIHSKIFLGVRVKGKKNLKKIKKEGYFIYSNHTHYYDAFLTQVFLGPGKRVYILCHPDAVNIPFIGGMVKMLGGLPIPTGTDFSNYKGLVKAINTRSQQKRVITIYPEGTLWQYYNGLRPFPSASFKYPALNNKPIVVVSETYRKSKFFKKYRMTLTVSEPIYPQPDKTVKENTEYLYNTALEILKKNVLVDTNLGYYNYQLKKDEEEKSAEN